MKFSQALEGYWLDKELLLSPNTKTSYNYYYKSFSDFIGDVEFENIKSSDVKRYLIWIVRDKGLSKRTASDRWIALSSLWRWAETELEIENIIRGKVARPKFTKTVIEPFTNGELKKLLNATKNTRLSAIVRLLLDSGMRVSELCNLKVADYDKETGKIFIRQGKGDKNRIVFIGNKTRKALWKLLINRECKESDCLFVTRSNTKFSRNNIRRDIAKLGKLFGIKAHPHKFRHTFAVSFLRNGGNLKQLQEILGHESIKTVTIYLKLAEIDIQQAKAFSPVDNL